MPASLLLALPANALVAVAVLLVTAMVLHESGWDVSQLADPGAWIEDMGWQAVVPLLLAAVALVAAAVYVVA